MMTKEEDKIEDLDEEDEEDEDAIKCEVCGDAIENEEDQHLVNDHMLCEGCAEFDHTASLRIIEPEEDEESIIRYHNAEICECFSGDDLESTFNNDVVKAAKAIMKGTYYHRYDAWRGTYAIKLENENDAVHLDDLQLLWGHHSEELEKRRMELLKRVIKKLHIYLIVAILPSSNLFCTNGDYFCCTKDAEIMQKVMTKLNELTEKDDPRWRIGVLFSDLQGSPQTKDAVAKLDATMKKLTRKPAKN